MRLVICDQGSDISEWTAKYIAKRIRDFEPNENKYFVLGLAHGSTFHGVYERLIKYNKAGQVSFKYVKTFNQIEFVNMPTNHPRSYHTYTYDNFAKHIDIDPENVFELNGNAADLVAECNEYEKKIKDAGGVEIFLAGLAFDGHVAFDECGSSLVSRTRVKTLSQCSLEELAGLFGNDASKVPKQVLTVGIATMLESEEVMIVVNGFGKAIPLQKVVEEGVNHMWTASAFQQHPRTIIICDEDATMELKVKTVKYFKDLWNIHSKLIEDDTEDSNVNSLVS